MSDDLSNEQLKHIVEELEINQPILAYKVVGDRIELRLLGGSTAVYDEGLPGQINIMQLLAGLSAKDLRFLAAKFMIKKRGTMNKIQLIEALAQQDPASVVAMKEKFNL